MVRSGLDVVLLFDRFFRWGEGEKGSRGKKDLAMSRSAFSLPGSLAPMLPG